MSIYVKPELFISPNIAPLPMCERISPPSLDACMHVNVFEIVEQTFTRKVGCEWADAFQRVAHEKRRELWNMAESFMILYSCPGMNPIELSRIGNQHVDYKRHGLDSWCKSCSNVLHTKAKWADLDWWDFSETNVKKANIVVCKGSGKFFMFTWNILMKDMLSEEFARFFNDNGFQSCKSFYATFDPVCEV